MPLILKMVILLPSSSRSQEPQYYILFVTTFSFTHSVREKTGDSKAQYEDCGRFWCPRRRLALGGLFAFQFQTSLWSLSCQQRMGGLSCTLRLWVTSIIFLNMHTNFVCILFTNTSSASLSGFFSYPFVGNHMLKWGQDTLTWCLQYPFGSWYSRLKFGIPNPSGSTMWNSGFLWNKMLNHCIQ